MANTDTKESGIQTWMSSVRASMANDPCRQLFEDQVQTHAFIFLDDYLEQILTGPKQGPIIELVKTPGRKKNAPRRTRAATAAAAKAKAITSLSLDDESTTREDAPVNSFHKALLQAKERAAHDSSNPRKPQLPSPAESSSSDNSEVQAQRPRSVKIAGIPEITISEEPGLQPGASHVQQHSETQTESLAPFPVSERGTELSVIAEGDESPERTRANMHTLSSPVPYDDEIRHVDDSDEHPRDQGNARNSALPDRMSQVDTILNIRDSGTSSATTFHSVPLDSPPVESRFGNHTQPLPSKPATSSPVTHERNAFTAPLPIVPVSNFTAGSNTMLVPLNDSSPRSSAPKGSAAGFPTLPAPSPLRKSMRLLPEAQIGHVPVPTVPAPVSVPLGKRTSWLMKAREAKALDGTNSHSNPFGITSTTAVIPRVSTAVKRKSGEMLGTHSSGTDKAGELRRPKVAKSSGVDTAPLMSKDIEKTPRGPPSTISEFALPAAVPMAIAQQVEAHPMEVDDHYVPLNDTEDGFIDLFKRTVEGLGARAGKSLGKSLSGAAAALAEARAAAEARVAERNKVQGEPSGSDAVHNEPDHEPLVVPRAEASDRPLSLEDLVSNTGKLDEPEAMTEAAQVINGHVQAHDADESVSTTPPDSPPSQRIPNFVKPSGPVFNKQPPPPVFMPPASRQPPAVSAFPRESPFNLPTNKFTLPATMSLGVPARLASPPHAPAYTQGASQPSAHSSQSSADPVFDQHDEASTWVPSTQDTSYTVDSQQRDGKLAIVDDDDDSWPLEEKLAAVESGWRPFDFTNVDKEDTWSSLPSESQGPTRSLIHRKDADTDPHPQDMDVGVDAKSTDDTREQEQEAVEISDVEPSDTEQSDIDARISTVNSVGPPARSNSQTSMASTSSSSQSQVGFFSQATKLVNSMLGGGKKAKPELKSLQLAAAAAKKQKEEAERKNQRLKEMEARRQGAIAKKAEEERARILEEERKSKEEAEKRKREREENTDKRPLKPPTAISRKTEDDTSKKRKVVQEAEKKVESKKPPSKDKKDVAPPLKLAKPSLATPATKTATVQKGIKATATALVSSAAYNATQNAPPSSSTKPVVSEVKPFKVAVPSSLKGKAKAKPQEDDMGDRLPSTVVQSQMAARAKAQMQAAKQQTPEVPSESIELPDINSEYSDSEDEDRVRTFDPPDWAQSPELRQALQMQSTVNPDDIFGAIRPLRMEEMFRTRQSRFRARTSSANWSGTDRLTVEEIREYERRMGFQQTHGS